MDLLNKLLHYSNDTLAIRSRMNECMKKCKRDFDSAILKKNTEIARLRDELKKIASDIDK